MGPCWKGLGFKDYRCSSVSWAPQCIAPGLGSTPTMNSLGTLDPYDTVLANCLRFTSCCHWNQEEDWRGSTQETQLHPVGMRPSLGEPCGYLGTLQTIPETIPIAHFSSLPASQGRLPMTMHPLEPQPDVASPFLSCRWYD